MAFVKVLIQNIDDSKFLTRTGEWTSQVSEALVFASAVEATLFLVENQLKNVQVVMRFNGRDLDLKLPLGQQRQESPPPTQNGL